MVSIYEIFRQPFDKRMHQYDMALTNAKENEAILTLLEPFQYGETVLRNLSDRVKQVRRLDAEQDQEKGEQVAATTELKATWAEAQSQHHKHAEIIGIEFEEQPELLRELHLLGAEPTNIGEWVETRSACYDALLENERYDRVRQELARRSVQTADLEATRDLIRKIRAADAYQDLQIAEAQDASQRKRTVVADLDKEMRKFYRYARLALEDNPQLLEALGIQVPS